MADTSRYMVLAWSSYDQNGGWGDFRGAAGDLGKARMMIEKVGWDQWQIVDRHSLEIVEDSYAGMTSIDPTAAPRAEISEGSESEEKSTK